jgi:hypothetical protein
VRSLHGQNSGPCRVLANDRRNCAHGLMIDSIVTAFALSWSLAPFAKSSRATVLWTVQECNVFMPLGIVLSEKRIPRFVGNVSG